MLVDLHAKSSISEDATPTIDQVLDRAVESGLDAIAFCERLSSAHCNEAVEKGRQRDLTVFIGLEIPTDKGLMLCFVPDIGSFYLGEEWRRLTDVTTPPAEAVFDLIDDHEGVVIAARPYDLQIPYNLGDRIFGFDKLDAVEVYNTRVNGTQRDFAIEAAAFMGVPTVGGSDSSDGSQVGRYATFFDEELTTQRQLVEALRNSKYWAVELEGDWPEAPKRQTRESSSRRSSKGGRRSKGGRGRRR